MGLSVRSQTNSHVPLQVKYPSCGHSYKNRTLRDAPQSLQRWKPAQRAALHPTRMYSNQPRTAIYLDSATPKISWSFCQLLLINPDKN